MLKRAGEGGFSLIELAVALAVLGVLIALGMPSFSVYIQTARLGNMAKSIYTGSQLARTEAIRRNQPVDFVLTDTPIAPGIETAAVPSVNGRNWVVALTNPAGVRELVEARSMFEGGGINPGMTTVSTAGVITFSPLGANAAAGTDRIDVANPPAGLCFPAGTVRCWQVVVSPGGQIRLCNPSGASAAAGDTRGC